MMLTSFLPGQEAGNVDVVLEAGFGDYCENPAGIAKEVTRWILDPTVLEEMSQKAQAVGHPDAAGDIVTDIGSRSHAWKLLNGPDVPKETVNLES
jgi:1,2-diacylglycerol 3-beta-galactosyltransferase